MPDISIDEERCTRCGACVAVCTSARVFELGESAARAARPEECWLCGHCVAVCPVDAVRHAEYPLEECPVIESPPSYEALIAAFRERRSLRVFRDKPVARETVRQLVDASRWVPSASNQQPVDWIALDDPEQIGRLSDAVVTTMGRTAELLNMRILRPLLSLVYGRAKIRDAVEAAEDFDKLARAHARGEDPIFHRAPVVLAAHVPEGAFFGRDDAVYAAYNLMLAAERLGLGTCHIGYVNAALERNEGILGILGLPAECQLEVVLTLGYSRFTFRRAVPRRRMALVWNPAEGD
jgi:nitroreductase/NAD-dependent dihydropyrimidine dehydrogenase PreA subunit